MKQQIITITQFVNALTDYLEDYFMDYHGLSFKCSNDPDAGDNTSVPFIYQYLMPSADLTEGYPNKSPCIVITIDNRNGNTYTLTLHLCVRYDSVSEKEKIHRVSDCAERIYEYSEEDGYDTKSDIELYKSSLLFNDIIYNVLLNFKGFTLQNMQSELPSSDLEDFPYSVSTISFDVQLNQFNIGQDPVNDLY